MSEHVDKAHIHDAPPIVGHQLAIGLGVQMQFAGDVELQTAAQIQAKLGEQRIDLITSCGIEDKRLIVKNAYRDGIILWEK